MKIVRIAALAALVLVAAALAGVGLPDPAQGQARQATDDVVTVNGTGVVTTTPDRAELGFGVVSQGQTARAAIAANGTAANRIVAALRAAGVAAADIQTQQVSLEPHYTEDEQRITGYTAHTAVSAAIRQLARAAAVIDAVVAAGANSVSGPMLTRSDATTLYRDALAEAVEDATGKAGVLAAAAGVRLGAIVSVVEAGASPVTPVAERMAAADAPEIEPGTQQIAAMVTVTFAID
jgi:uncharacterized protein YggE